MFFVEISFSKTIEIQNKNFYSNIVLLNDKIHYTEELLDLSLSQKKCNHSMMNKLKQSIEENLKSSFPPMGKDLLVIKVDGKAKAFDLNSPAGTYFYKFGEVMKAAKLEDQFSCR